MNVCSRCLAGPGIREDKLVFRVQLHYYPAHSSRGYHLGTTTFGRVECHAFQLLFDHDDINDENTLNFLLGSTAWTLH